MKDENTNSQPPSRIYLQIGDDSKDLTDVCWYEVSWCADKCDESDIPYVLEADHKAAKRDARKFKKALDELTVAVSQHIALLDAEMDKPSDQERGRRIAKICNTLDMANDSVLHITLNQSFQSIGNRKAKFARKV